MEKKYVFECIMKVHINAVNEDDAYEKLYDTDRINNPDIEIVFEDVLGLEVMNEKSVTNL